MSITHRAASAAFVGLSFALISATLSAPIAAQSQPARAQAQPKEPGLKATALWALDGEIQGDRFGAAIATLPDLDGDGLPELLVGAPNRQPFGFGTKGHAYVLSGASGAVLRVHEGWNKGDRMGHSVAQLPDLDGDGVPDYGAGAIWAIDVLGTGIEAPGAVGIWSGADGHALQPVTGAGTWECFGAALNALGDVDGDGVGDLLVTARFGGAPEGDPDQAPGHVRILSGGTGALLTQVAGASGGDWLGFTAVTLPDLDGDGLPDIAAGAWAANEERGLVEILSGDAGTALGSFGGSEHGETFGYALAALPDLDGDGHAELAVGSPLAHLGQGRVTVVSPVGGQTLHTVEGSLAGERLGMAVSAIGDRDGDGLTELAIGAPFWDDGHGRVLIVTLAGKVLATIHGTMPEGNFGETLQPLPDLNGDGLGELAIGAPLSATSESCGRVVVVSLH